MGADDDELERDASDDELERVRALILARRNRFVAAALAGLGMTSGCASSTPAKGPQGGRDLGAADSSSPTSLEAGAAGDAGAGEAGDGGASASGEAGAGEADDSGASASGDAGAGEASDSDGGADTEVDAGWVGPSVCLTPI